MERTIERVSFSLQKQPKAIRVAAYARVSSGKDAMLHSLSAQISYYSDLIKEHPDWLYCGVYVDEALTGTKETRENFQRLLSDCRNGKIDMVITKSVSRFARNTVTLLKTVRELKALGIDVFFEEQNIHTISSEGELMLTILASYAQEESLSASENQKWRVRRNFEEGKPWSGMMLGYRLKDGQFVVEPGEAEVVRHIFQEYLSGKGTESIAKGLNEAKVLTRNGYTWHPSTVRTVLRNYNYTGNLILQKTFRENHISKKKIFNRGEKPKYLVENAHEPIISLEIFEAVQDEFDRRAKKFNPKAKQRITYPFSSKIICAKCGKHYRRKTTATGPIWICSTYNSKGRSACASKAIPENVLIEITKGIPFDEIIADDGNILKIRLGSCETIKRWKDKSRSESWTDEMRKKAGERRKNGGKNSKGYSCNGKSVD